MSSRLPTNVTYVQAISDHEALPVCTYRQGSETETFFLIGGALRNRDGRINLALLSSDFNISKTSLTSSQHFVQDRNIDCRQDQPLDLFRQHLSAPANDKLITST